MALPPLPKRDADTWDIRQAFKPTEPIHAVSARDGRVLAAGDHRNSLAKGAVQWLGAELPDDIPGPAWFAALDPRSRKYALSTDEGVHIFYGKEGGDRVAHIRPGKRVPPEDESGSEDDHDEDAVVEGLAWGRLQGKSALYVAWNPGRPGILLPDEGYGLPLELPPMAAAAYDDTGTVALLSTGEGRIYVTRNGEAFVYRGLDFDEAFHAALPEELDFPIHLAVAGKAVAWSFGNYGAFVSRDFPNQPFEKCEALAHAGPLAFEGSSSDAALFGGIWTEAHCSIVRVEASGRATRIADLGLGDGKAASPFDDLAWDPSRKCLFAVHPDAGLLVAASPEAKRGKLPAPS